MIYDKCRREENIIMQQERNVCKMVSTITIELVSFFTWVRVALRKRNPKKYVRWYQIGTYLIYQMLIEAFLEYS